jgi:hypothetical protein
MRLLPYGTFISFPSSPFSREAPLTAVSAMPPPPPSPSLLARKAGHRHCPSCLVRRLGPLLPVVLLPPLSLHRCLPFALEHCLARHLTAVPQGLGALSCLARHLTAVPQGLGALSCPCLGPSCPQSLSPPRFHLAPKSFFLPPSLPPSLPGRHLGHGRALDVGGRHVRQAGPWKRGGSPSALPRGGLHRPRGGADCLREPAYGRAVGGGGGVLLG